VLGFKGDEVGLYRAGQAWSGHPPRHLRRRAPAVADLFRLLKNGDAALQAVSQKASTKEVCRRGRPRPGGGLADPPRRPTAWVRRRPTWLTGCICQR
jgi:hypothetical protein